MLLTKEELESLTCRKTKAKQIEALRMMGFEVKIRPDGSPAVLKDHVQKVMGGMVQSQPPKVKPNFDALNG